MSGRALRIVRALTVTTAEWPLLGTGYRAIYGATVARLARALADVDGALTARLRGTATRDVRPGLSDVDALVVLRAGASAREELDAVYAVGSRVARVNVPFPLVRDVHVVTPGELAAWGRLAVYLLGALHVDSVPLVGDAPLPPCARGRALVGESLRRGVAWWTDRGLRQLLLEPGIVGSRLAARSFAKAGRFAAAVRAGPDDILETMRTYNAPTGSEAAGWADAIRALSTLDAALGDAPRLPTELERAHPVIDRAAPALARWVEPLRRVPGIDAAVLSVEGASAMDLRLYVVVDPAHRRAAEALAAVASHVRRRPLRHREWFARCPFPVVVTRRMLERSVLLRWTALEPIARRRHARSLFGSVPAVHARPDEVLRSLAYEAAHLLGSARELVRSGGDEAAVGRRLRDLGENVAESYAAALRGQWRTEPVVHDPAARGIASAYETLHGRVGRVRDALVDAAVAPLEGSDG